MRDGIFAATRIDRSQNACRCVSSSISGALANLVEKCPANRVLFVVLDEEFL
jgi:hypothetical protein